MLDTNNRAEGFVHPPKQEKDTEAMASTLPVELVTGGSRELGRALPLTWPSGGSLSL